ncbi:MAG: ferrous iron transport protein B [Candidatus Micrarchaeia archaeon]
MRKIRVALAGNANVGKSVIFNYLTGLHQHIANWPGKTVEKMEGTLKFKGYEIDVVDLPGIYSLSTYSQEELISREYIALQKPDVVINVVDASALERNLMFTIQLLELETPLVIALNMMDVAERRGIDIDHEKLSAILGVPVVPVIATRGIGIYALIEKAIESVEKDVKGGMKVRYCKMIEDKIGELSPRLENLGLPYPVRWVALKLLEGDEEIIGMIEAKNKEVVQLAEKMREEIEAKNRRMCCMSIATERYAIVNKIVGECQQIKPLSKPSLEDRIDDFVLHRVFGYVLLAIVVLSIFYLVFGLGTFLSDIFSELAGSVPSGSLFFGESFWAILWDGFFEGIIAGISIAIPYLIPFFIILSLLEDSGYLARMSFLMDRVMHLVGLHGKAFLPMMLGYGCNVPACLGCRIMETEGERFLAAFVSTLVPCAARTVVILGLVGTYLGSGWAMGMYAINFVFILLLGRLAFKMLPGEPVGLIMEMPSYKMPSVRGVFLKTWFKLQDFVYIAFPILVVSTLAVKLMEFAGLLEPVSAFLSPITVGWLGLPAFAGITLIFGVLRKELTLVLLVALSGTTNLSAVLSPLQMVVFTLVTLFYIPCVATISTLVKEFGWKRALAITLFEIAFAILLGGIALRILPYMGLT